MICIRITFIPIYINYLHKTIINSHVYYFVDDTNLLLTNKFPPKINKLNNLCSKTNFLKKKKIQNFCTLKKKTCPYIFLLFLYFLLFIYFYFFILFIYLFIYLLSLSLFPSFSNFSQNFVQFTLITSSTAKTSDEPSERQFGCCF